MIELHGGIPQGDVIAILIDGALLRIVFHSSRRFNDTDYSEGCFFTDLTNNRIFDTLIYVFHFAARNLENIGIMAFVGVPSEEEDLRS
ncbi:hypothetical protein ColTof3_07128 [Colletotrichum tofieldiae]|nr:hypothetical protein ColTof3_07128 [Colletotrichum tofieldiae]GKT85964.1 hypothetical protein Ct61P_03814 [Colletotrichum tofieldiae]